GDSEVKSLKEVDLYDFLDYMIGKGQQNEATSALKDALIRLKNYEKTPTPSPDKSPSLSTRADKGGGYQNTPAQKDTPTKSTPQSDDLAAQNQNLSKDIDTLALEKSLEKRFNDFEKQANERAGRELSVKEFDEWFENEAKNGNKEILDYKKDLAKYREIDDKARAQAIAQEQSKYITQKTQQWLEKYKNDLSGGKTDAEIIASNNIDFTKGKQDLSFMRKNIESNYGIKPAQEFGTNYAEFYKDGQGAIQKLLAEASAAKQAGEEFNGQVAGAFKKQIDGVLSDIDLVWGKITDAQKHEGYGLSHIIDKHPELDLHKIPEIIERGEVESKKGITTIWHKDSDGKIYKLGISQGFNGKGDNKWVVTAYEVEREKDKTFGDTLFTTKRPLENPDEQIIQHTAEKIQ
ncbi:putative barnase/colicin E5 family endoribonuclease, partial [Helicobacter sp. T3_23-1059]